MKYPYIVCKDGKWYPAGTEVPEDAKTEPTDESVQEQDKPDEGQGEVNEDSTDAKATDESVQEQDKPKRGRKSKEE